MIKKGFIKSINRIIYSAFNFTQNFNLRLYFKNILMLDIKIFY